MDKNKEIIKKLKYVCVDTIYVEEYVSYLNIDKLTYRLMKLLNI